LKGFDPLKMLTILYPF